MTNTQQQQQQQIMRLTSWTADVLSELIYDAGVLYLHHYIGRQHSEVTSYILRSKTYWDWWKMQWQLRDYVFCESITREIDQDLARQLYLNLHDAATLAAEIYLNGQVLGDSYNLMIAKLNKEVLHA